MNGALQVGLCSRKALPRPLWTPSELWLSSLTTAAPVTHPNTSGTKQNPTHTARRGKTAWKDTARLALFAPVCSAKVEQFSLSIKYLRLLSPKSAVLVFAVAGSLATACVCVYRRHERSHRQMPWDKQAAEIRNHVCPENGPAPGVSPKPKLAHHDRLLAGRTLSGSSPSSRATFGGGSSDSDRESVGSDAVTLHSQYTAAGNSLAAGQAAPRTAR
jgi:hypothetical protein